MMKKVWMFIVILCTIGYVYGQNKKKNYFGVHYLLGSCNYSNVNHEGKNYYGIWLDYKYRYSENSELCLGITATVNNMSQSSSNSWHQSYPGGSSGGVNTSNYGDQLFIFSLPVHFRQYFHYFFIGGGPCLNLHPSKGYKWGIGVEVNAGVEYVFKSGLAISVSPQGQWNWLNIFKNENSFGGIDRLSKLGVNIGLGYRFGKQ